MIIDSNNQSITLDTAKKLIKSMVGKMIGTRITVDTPLDAKQVVPLGYLNGRLSSIAGSPGGSNRRIQFNNAGVFGGDNGFVLNEAITVSLDDGLYNVVIGAHAGDNIGSVLGFLAPNNTLIGTNAGRVLFTSVFGQAANNTAVGSSALSSTTSGTSNTAVGAHSLAPNTTGDYNTAIGAESGGAVSTGQGNVYVGYGQGKPTIGQESWKIRIGTRVGSVLSQVFYGESNTGTVVLGPTVISSVATDGFVYIPTTAAAPSGVPTSQGGSVPIIYDTANNKLWAYNSGWKSVTFT